MIRRRNTANTPSRVNLTKTLRLLMNIKGRYFLSLLVPLSIYHTCSQRLLLPVTMACSRLACQYLCDSLRFDSSTQADDVNPNGIHQYLHTIPKPYFNPLNPAQQYQFMKQRRVSATAHKIFQIDPYLLPCGEQLFTFTPWRWRA